MNKNLSQFSMYLDQLLGIHPGRVNTNFASPTEKSALQIASHLKDLDFDSELAPRAGLRTQWMNQTRPTFPLFSPQRLLAVRTAWFAALIVALALLLAFRQPVLAAVSRLFGVVYIQEAGFLPADSTRVLQQPIRQEHTGQSLTVLRGIATPTETTLWLEFSDTARPVDGAILTNESGLRLDVSYWQYSSNSPKARGVVLHFPALPMDARQTTLSLPEGWQLPLAWIPASQSRLPDVRAVPYPAASPMTTQSPSSKQAPAAEPLCQQQHDVKLCVLAAATAEDNTSILVELQALAGNLSAGGWPGKVWQSEQQPATLRDEQGNPYPMSQEQDGTLLFPPVTPNQQVTLTIPAVLASLDISNQTIRVDMGDNPQPNTVIPLDITIPVLGTSVHFSQATFVGDGVGSLRLTLDADPVQTVDGITPVSIEIGKPDRVDDLYGGGMLADSKDIFIELMRPSGKVTGVINIPLEKAVVAVSGPFEFTFNLPDAASLTPEPATADPNTFSPAPTATPLPLDSYSWSGETLTSGDLLYTVIDGEKTDLYVFTPGAAQPRLFATLPGAVSQVYIHPDRNGLDYLAGVETSRDEVNYIKDLSLYSLTFDGKPRLLYTFPPTPENTIGTIVEGNWSFDGRYAVFRYAQPQPGNDFSRFLVIDLVCRSTNDCVTYPVALSPDQGLFSARFAPADYRILFTGSDYSLTGETDLFVLNFDPAIADAPAVNITANSSDFADDVGASPAIWMPDGKIFTLCNNGQDTSRFCAVDASTGAITSGAVYKEHLFQYQLSLSGNQVIGVVINHQATGKGVLELHLYDLNGQAGPALATGRSLEYVSMSPSEQFIVYSVYEEGEIHLLDVLTGETSLLANKVSGNISWIGWVR